MKCSEKTFIEARVRLVIAWGWGWGERAPTNGHKESLGDDGNVLIPAFNDSYTKNFYEKKITVYLNT